MPLDYRGHATLPDDPRVCECECGCYKTLIVRGLCARCVSPPNMLRPRHGPRV